MHGSQCVKSVRIRSFSGPYFSAFIQTTERYEVSLRIQSKCGKIRTKKLRIRTLFTQCVSVENDIAISFAPNTVLLKRKQSAMYSNWSFLQMQVYRSHYDMKGKLPIKKKNSILGLTENSFFQGQHHVWHIWCDSLSLSNLSLVAVSFWVILFLYYNRG